MMRPALAQLGPYELIRTLNRPGRAEVYLGRMHQQNPEVEVTASGRDLPEQAIIKVLRPPDQIDPSQQARVQEALARFIEEGRLSTRLRHPAIARTWGVGFDRGQNLHFLIQEYVDGVTLAQLLDHCASREMKLPYSVVLRLIIPVLRALHYAYHDALREDGRPLRVVHRDIKPANIMFSYDGRALLLDLHAAWSTSFTRQQTVQDVVVGTAHYLAPEQVYDPQNVGHQTDIFAMGVVLYELATLMPLLPRTRRLSEIATALARFNFADHAVNIDPAIYPGLAEVLAQALSPEPTTRFLTAGDFARELEGLLLRAEDGPGLPAFASRMRQEWQSSGEGGEKEERRAVDLTGKASPRTTDAAASSLPAPAAESHAPGPKTVALPPHALIQPLEPQSAQPAPNRRLLELAIAALIGFIGAAAVLFLMQAF